MVLQATRLDSYLRLDKTSLVPSRLSRLLLPFLFQPVVSSGVPCSQGLRNEPKEPACARTAAEWSDLSVSCVFRWQITKQMCRKNNWKQKKCSVPVEWHLQLTSFFKTTGLISLYKKVQFDWDSVRQSALEGKGAGIVRNLIVPHFGRNKCLYTFRNWL